MLVWTLLCYFSLPTLEESYIFTKNMFKSITILHSFGFFSCSLSNRKSKFMMLLYFQWSRKLSCFSANSFPCNQSSDAALAQIKHFSQILLCCFCICIDLSSTVQVLDFWDEGTRIWHSKGDLQSWSKLLSEAALDSHLKLEADPSTK